MRIFVNKAHFPVTVLGYGRRVGIWLQGCSIQCPGCISRDTWEQDEQYLMPIDTLLDWCRSWSTDGPDGATISGGEPFDQPQALSVLLTGLRQWASTLDRPFDLLCYSGYPYRLLRKRFPHILAQLDVLIPERFIEDRPGAPLRGSDNQPVMVLSDLGRQRYGGAGLDALGGKRMQMAVEAKRIWFIGIPAPGDMQRLELRCRQLGLLMGSCSWRP